MIFYLYIFLENLPLIHTVMYSFNEMVYNPENITDIIYSLSLDILIIFTSLMIAIP